MPCTKSYFQGQNPYLVHVTGLQYPNQSHFSSSNNSKGIIGVSASRSCINSHTLAKFILNTFVTSTYYLCVKIYFSRLFFTLSYSLN